MTVFQVSLIKILFILALSFMMSLASVFAQESSQSNFRWTGAEHRNPSLSTVLSVIELKTGKKLSESQFLLQEDRLLAYSRYQYFAELSGGVPVEGKSIRIWSDRDTGETIQVEAFLDLSLASSGVTERAPRVHVFNLDDSATLKIVKKALRKHDSKIRIQSIEWKDRVVGRDLQRLVSVKTKRGVYKISILHGLKKVVSVKFEPYPEADAPSVQALVYPIYEEVEGTGMILSRSEVTLKHLARERAEVPEDPYASLRSKRYFETTYSPSLGSTEQGRAQGFWSMSYLKGEAKKITELLPKVENSFENGMLLYGDYATINIHPDAFLKLKGITLPKKASSAFFPNWVEVDYQGERIYEMIPGSAFYGKPITSQTEVLSRKADRLPDHNPASYINEGFDEIQVYYAINTLMEELQMRGLSDPDLSTRPFHAYLFNPDIEYRDNAYYTDDTINFTTYSEKQPNMARDNPTIWHELGHGIMDRLMGDQIHLADTGGLSEGMADFVAQIVVQAVTNNKPFPGSENFRIINQTGFFLTNEVHDDGEAYGGTMNDLMMKAIELEGQVGLRKVTDVILEAMRLCRDHPALTAKEWFQHLLFADSLGRKDLRAPGELSALITQALNGRNFNLEGAPPAEMKLVNADTGIEVIAGEPGSRGHEIPVELNANETKDFKLAVNLKSSGQYAFQYPLQVRVEYRAGALQGAVRFAGEETGPALYTLNSEADTLLIPLQVSGTCDYKNREDGSCSDYAYIQVFEKNDLKPRAKKRFYVRVKTK